MNSRITVRLMAELPDEATVLRFENMVQARIAAFGSIRQSEMKHYWKVPEWFEINLYLHPSTAPGLAYDGILASLGAGWERHDISNVEQWAVWNPKEGSTFFSLHVRWANVERFPATCVVSQ
jgi:hypothetical protein